MALGSRPTRSGGRRWFLLFVLATLVVLTINAALSSGSPAPIRALAQQTYLDQMLPAIQQSTQEGMDIDAVRAQALTLGPTTLNSRLQQVAANANQTLAVVRGLLPPQTLQIAHDLLLASLSIRADGSGALRSAIRGATAGQATAVSAQQLVDVGRDFDAGDRTYALFLKAMPNVGLPMPASRWLANPSNYAEPDVSVFLASLKSAASTTPVHDVSVVLFTTDPAAVSVSGANQVLSISKTLSLQIVVADTGNQPEKNMTVSATIAPTAIGPTQMVRDFVDLAPGQRRTVQLGGLRPQPGVVTTLTIKIDAAPGENNVADNTKVVTFVMQ